MGQQLAGISADDQRFLAEAADYLEHPRFLMRVANLVGKPAEALLGRLPESAQRAIADTTHSALETALRWAVRTLADPSQASSGTRLQLASRAAALRRLEQHVHTAVAATTGAVGGFWGLPGMAVEVPATTVVMLRSIARVAAEEGFPLDDPQTRLHCLAVLSLGSQRLSSMESAYLGSRLGLALAIRDASAFFAKHSASEITEALSKGTAPVLARLLNVIASRFQVVLSQKMAAQSVPVAGAAMGALVNAAFADHFNRVARYHFGILRLEKRYGREMVQAAYRRALQSHRQIVIDRSE